MGRCYDFGVSVDPSSEHAMVVAPEGGHCVCPTTGTTCDGRFQACAEIVSKPGRIPPSAPTWSVPALKQRQEAATADGGSLKVSGELQAVETTEGIRGIGQISSIVESIRGDIADIADSRQTVSVEDLAEAVLTAREDLTAQLAEAVDALQLSATEQADDRNQATLGPLQKVARALLELRDAQDRTTQAVASIAERVTESGRKHEAGLAELRSDVAAVRGAVEAIANRSDGIVVYDDGDESIRL